MPPEPPDWSPTTPPVTESDFHTFPVLVLHYWAAWNLVDRKMDQRLLRLRDEYAGRICFRSCDADRAENLPFLKGIANLPTLGCFIRGEWFKSLIGLREEHELRSTFDTWLAAAAPTRPQPTRTAAMLSSLRNLLARGAGR